MKKIGPPQCKYHYPRHGDPERKQRQMMGESEIPFTPFPFSLQLGHSTSALKSLSPWVSGIQTSVVTSV